MQILDAILNRYTMYRIILYGLAALLVVAELLALSGAVAVSPGGLVISTVTLIAGCYLANKLFSRLLHVPYNRESWLISALILACIMPPRITFARIGLLLVTALVAMASKYLLTYRGSHIVNPVAFGALVMSVAGLLPATWWIASPALAPFTVLLAIIVLRKQRRFTLFIIFTLAALTMLLFVSGVLHGQPLESVLKNAVLSWPIIFFGSIMLSEPTTLPPSSYYQALYALLVGVIFACQLHIGPVSATPQVALIIGNLFTLLVAPPLGLLLKLKTITQLSSDSYDLAFEKPAVLQFTPGQYMEWTLPHKPVDSRGNRRTFSIASSPTEPLVHIGIRTYTPGSSFKKALLALKPGAFLRAAHVAGSFTLPADQARPLLLVAGGIGITPFRSMVQWLVDSSEQRDVVLLYLARTEQDFVYRDVFARAEAAGLKTLYYTGQLDEGALFHLVPDAADRLVYLSGPDAMVTHLKRLMRRLGTPITHIKTDHFSGY